jgi:hypothetical protein
MNTPLIPGSTNFDSNQSDTLKTIKILSKNLIIDDSLFFEEGRIFGLPFPINQNDAVSKEFVDNNITNSFSPNGPENSLQINDNGTLQGSSHLIYDNSLNQLKLSGALKIGSLFIQDTIENLSDPMSENDLSNLNYINKK